MTKNELNDAYFNWMYQLVFDGRYSKRLSYQKLLRELHRIEFTYSIPMDGNRAEDGVDLRYRFGYENGYSSSMVSTYLDNRTCSVLEMMIALAIRCEEHIMDDPDIGNRTGQWFWNMIVNLLLCAGGRVAVRGTFVAGCRSRRQADSRPLRCSGRQDDALCVARGA